MFGRRTRDVVLAVSLLTNVFVFGAAAGLRASGARVMAPLEVAALRGEGDRLDFTPRAYLAALPAKERRALRAIALREGRDALPLMRSLRERQRAALEIASVDPVDAQALDAALDDLRSAQNALVERGHDVLLALIEATDPEIRNAVIARAQKRERGPGGLRRGRSEAAADAQP